jgi:hypothetical protein
VAALAVWLRVPGLWPLADASAEPPHVFVSDHVELNGSG